jgi:hypothetical protein
VVAALQHGLTTCARIHCGSAKSCHPNYVRKFDTSIRLDSVQAISKSISRLMMQGASLRCGDSLLPVANTESRAINDTMGEPPVVNIFIDCQLRLTASGSASRSRYLLIVSPGGVGGLTNDTRVINETNNAVTSKERQQISNHHHHHHHQMMTQNVPQTQRDIQGSASIRAMIYSLTSSTESSRRQVIASACSFCVNALWR